MSNLWVDDERTPPADGTWTWSKTAQNTIDTLELTTSRFSVISLDYSLGLSGGWDNNGGTVLEWPKVHPEKWPTDEIRCHSSSSSGRGLLEHLANKYKPAGWTGKITDTGGF